MFVLFVYGIVDDEVVDDKGPIMTRTAAGAARTYLLEDVDGADIERLAQAFRESGDGKHPRSPAFVDADGLRHEIPAQLLDVLVQVTSALASGSGVTVAPHSALLTTQEAADMLGVSRPTLVRLLESGDLPMEKPGRHRFVRLGDLLAYQDRVRSGRRAVLDDAARAGVEDGLYDATDGVAPPRR